MRSSKILEQLYTQAHVVAAQNPEKNIEITVHESLDIVTYKQIKHCLQQNRNLFPNNVSIALKNPNKEDPFVFVTPRYKQ